VYSQIVREVAAKENVPLIDMDKKGQQLYQQMGVEHSKLLFLQLKPVNIQIILKEKKIIPISVNWEQGLIAQIVLKEIKDQIPELADRIFTPVKK
jgi:hypothetical protein